MGSELSKDGPVVDVTENTQTDEFFYLTSLGDVLIDILSFVPYEDLIKNCRLVCKDWKALIDGHSVWKLKCERKRIKVPKSKKPYIPMNYYRNIYFFEKAKGNLIKNPCGDDQLNGWTILELGGDGVIVENPPEGADPVPAVVGSQSCFATSYLECRKYQEIDLYENKVTKCLLQEGVLKIRVGDWYAARFDCASEYELTVSLMSSNRTENNDFTFKYREEQWKGRAWHHVTYEFKDVSNARYVSFCHAGQDRQYWAGHYGSKFTGSYVELCLKD